MSTTLDVTEETRIAVEGATGSLQDLREGMWSRPRTRSATEEHREGDRVTEADPGGAAAHRGPGPSSHQRWARPGPRRQRRGPEDPVGNRESCARRSRAALAAGRGELNEGIEWGGKMKKQRCDDIRAAARVLWSWPLAVSAKPAQRAPGERAGGGRDEANRRGDQERGSLRPDGDAGCGSKLTIPPPSMSQKAT